MVECLILPLWLSGLGKSCASGPDEFRPDEASNNLSPMVSSDVDATGSLLRRDMVFDVS
jgi:hypothetical protein